jgi:GNAT superfamily N-acetyltransferase
MPPRPYITTGTEADLPWLIHLQRRYSDELGHIPTSGLRDRLRRRQVLIVGLDDQEAGYLIYAHHPLAGAPGIPRARRGTVHITQAAVTQELWRHGLGALAVAEVHRRSSPLVTPYATVTVRDHHPAMPFWRAIGYRPVRVRPGGLRRRRMLLDLLRPLMHTISRPRVASPPNVV